MNSQELALRSQALETASRLGLPHELTLKAARAYLDFLQDKEPGAEWTVAANSIANQLRATLKQKGAGKTVTKKAVPKPTRRRA
jgi:hypothetical protein